MAKKWHALKRTPDRIDTRPRSAEFVNWNHTSVYSRSNTEVILAV
jgi:hypothetical protein